MLPFNPRSFAPGDTAWGNRGTTTAKLNITDQPTWGGGWSACGWAVRQFAPAGSVWHDIMTLGMSSGLTEGMDIGYPGTTTLGIEYATTSSWQVRTFSKDPGFHVFFWAVAMEPGNTLMRAYWGRPVNFEWWKLDSAGHTLQTSMTNLAIYVSSSPFDEHFAGNLWGLTIWEKALSEADFQKQMFSKLPLIESKLWAWWPLDGGPHRVRRDFSGNRRHLTITGTRNTDWAIDPGPKIIYPERIRPVARKKTTTSRLVQEKGNYNASNGTSLSVVLDAAATVGNVLHVITEYDTSGGVSSSISDDKAGGSHTYTSLGGLTNGSNAERADHHFVKVLGAITTVTLSTPNNNSLRGMLVREITGVDGDQTPASSIHLMYSTDVQQLLMSNGDSMLWSPPLYHPYTAFISGSCNNQSGGGTGWTMKPGANYSGGLIWHNGDGIAIHREEVSPGAHQATWTPNLTASAAFTALAAAFKQIQDFNRSVSFLGVYASPRDSTANGSNQIDLTITVPTGCKTMLVFAGIPLSGATANSCAWDPSGVNQDVPACGTTIQAQGGSGWGNTRIFKLDNPVPGASKLLRTTISYSASQASVIVVLLGENYNQISYGGENTYQVVVPGFFYHKVEGVQCNPGDLIFTSRSDDLGTAGAGGGQVQEIVSADSCTLAQVPTGTGDSYQTVGYMKATKSAETVGFYVDELVGSDTAAFAYVVLRQVVQAEARQYGPDGQRMNPLVRM